MTLGGALGITALVVAAALNFRKHNVNNGTEEQQGALASVSELDNEMTEQDTDDDDDQAELLGASRRAQGGAFSWKAPDDLFLGQQEKEKKVY